MTERPDPADLFERHHMAVFRYFYRLTGRRDAAEDLTQDVFVRALRGLSQYEAQEREQGWVFRIARNVFIDRHRHDVRATPTTQELSSELPAPAIPHPEQVIDLDRGLAQLESLDREVFLLREVAGLGYAEISSVCGITPDAVRSRISRARRKLRTLLGEHRVAACR